MHRLDTLVFGHILVATAAVANGYAFGDSTYQYALSRTKIILIVFIFLYVHPQLTHIWIDFRGAPGRIFLSPITRSITRPTRSTSTRTWAATWRPGDWLFGTLYIPARKREKLTFGIDPAYPDARIITGEFLSSFGRAINVVLGWVHRLPEPAAGSSG